MKPNNRSILKNLEYVINKENLPKTIENRANHVVSSVSNLIESIERTFNDEQAEELTKKLMSSIRNKDPKRFSRAINKIEKERSNQNEK